MKNKTDTIVYYVKCNINTMYSIFMHKKGYLF